MLFGLFFEGINVVGAVDLAHLHPDLHRLIGELLDGVPLACRHRRAPTAFAPHPLAQQGRLRL